MGSASDTQALIQREPYRTLLDELLSRAESELRFVFVYGPEDVDVAYLRGNLLQDDLVSQVSELHARAKHVETMPDSDIRPSYGPLELVISVHTDVVVLQFVGPDGTGLVATADRSEDVLHDLLRL